MKNTTVNWLFAVYMLQIAGPAQAREAVYRDLARDPSAGLDYVRVVSPRNELIERFRQAPVYTLADVAATPMKARGAPGILLFDADGDGDVDLYVTNGPGADNSLFMNELADRGVISFVDRGAESGLGATDHDSSGVCAGDIDNDGDTDVLVLGGCDTLRLYRNDGGGRFTDITPGSGMDRGVACSASCSMGDVNGDGLLDVVVANTYTSWDNQLALLVEPFALNRHNELFVNLGGGRFEERGEAAGLHALTGLEGAPDGQPTLTWAIALVDIDRDGDVDIVQADDQSAIPPASRGGFDRGVIRVLKNDGAGNFTDRTREAGLDKVGTWMGLAFGDFDCNGTLDLFATNFGDYAGQLLPTPAGLGELSSRWFLQRRDGRFDDPGVGRDRASAYGWGVSAIDYDNDGDTDIVYHGGSNIGPFVDSSNPGVILDNSDCSGEMEFRPEAGSGTDHSARNVQGVATADLDDNGYPDIVSVSNFTLPETALRNSYPVSYGSPFDGATYTWLFDPVGPGEFVFNGTRLRDGDLSVELHTGGEHGWVKVRLSGTVGLLDGAHSNRDGIGAVVGFTPRHGQTQQYPVLAGSSYASQNDLELIFGLGKARSGEIEILWPGGVVNRLYHVSAGERVVFPEIPCSIYSSMRPHAYRHCVTHALHDLLHEGVLTGAQAFRFYGSALRAFREERYGRRGRLHASGRGRHGAL